MDFLVSFLAKAVLIAVDALIVYVLWSPVAMKIFHLPEISYMDALLLRVFVSVLAPKNRLEASND